MQTDPFDQKGKKQNVLAIIIKLPELICQDNIRCFINKKLCDSVLLPLTFICTQWLHHQRLHPGTCAASLLCAKIIMLALCIQPLSSLTLSKRKPENSEQITHYPVTATGLKQHTSMSSRLLWPLYD